MPSLDEFFKIDCNISRIYSCRESQVSGICDPSSLEKNGLLFIKGKEFINNFFDKIKKEIPHLHFCFDELLWESFDEDEKVIWKDALSLLKTSSMPKTLSLLSHFFYQKKRDSLNSYVDGRQMGTAEVDPSVTISQNVFMGENVKIHKGVRIHPGAVILSQVEIGEDSEIFPGVTVYPDCKIGSRVRIHAGSTIGSDGFGYNFEDGVHYKVWHMGGVHISDDVEIGACSCVDGGTFSPTFIGKGCKIDNHVQVGHNCKIGQGVLLCGHVAIGGSAVIEDFCVFGGKSALGDHVHLGKGSHVAGAAMVNSNWPAGSQLGGHPARKLKEWKRGVAYLRKESLRKKRDYYDPFKKRCRMFSSSPRAFSLY